MDERQLRNVLDDVRAGRLSRRAFLESMLGFGLTAPLVAQMFAAVDVASAQPKPAFSPTKRGGGGLLKTLWWQAPTLLNPHFATGTKDQDACRIFYEPLASYDPDGNRSEEHTSELQSRLHLVCRLLLEKKKTRHNNTMRLLTDTVHT